MSVPRAVLERIPPELFHPGRGHKLARWLAHRNLSLTLLEVEQRRRELGLN